MTSHIETLAATCAASASKTDASGMAAEHAAEIASAGLYDLEANGAPFSARAEALRRLAHNCGASAWMAASGARAAAHVMQISAKARADVGAGFIATATAPTGAILKRDGEMATVTGVWPAVAGLAYAEWIILDGVRDGETLVSVIVPTKDLNATPYPYFGGLRGLSWRSVEARSVRVPAHRIGAALNQDVTIDPLLGAVLGAAEGVYALYTTSTKARISGVGGHAVARFTQVQARLAESHVELKACRALYGQLLADADAGRATPEMLRDQAYIVRTAMAAAHRLLSQMGAMGLSETNPVQRQFRDLRAFASAPAFNWDRNLAAFGRAELGVDTPRAV